MSKAIYAPVGGFFEKQKKAYAAADGVLRKLKKGYAVVGGMHKLVFSAGPSVMYTGTHTISQIDIGGVTYNLLTMTGSGVLTVDGGTVQGWICGGGSGGCTPNANFPHPVGGSGGFVDFDELIPGKYAVVIGTGGSQNNNGGDTTISDENGTETLKAAGGNFNGPGGCGGGGAWAGNSIAGQKGGCVSTVPYGIEELGAHSAGGGAGATILTLNSSGNYDHAGGNGGSNGGDGSNSTEYGSSPVDAKGGTGGEIGGGNGGGNHPSDAYYNAITNGSSGTFYGAGGGSPGMVWNPSSDTFDSGDYTHPYNGTGGKGYQGVGYVLWHEEGIPYDWEPFRIVTQPVGGVTPCTMTCEATGNGVTYQWQKYATLVGWSDISGATSDTYTGTAGTSFLSSSTRYRCKVTDATGAVFYSNEVTVTKS